MQLDHVLIAVADLAAAGGEFEARYGLVSVDGGRHPGWGTANRIVPLGETYLELVAAVDEAEAAQSPFGSWVARSNPAPAGLLGWAVRTNDLDAIARRLGLSVASGSRATRSGGLLRWRLAGLEQAAAEPSLPFFMEWERRARLPGQAPATHRTEGLRITELRLEGDADGLASWLGADDLPISVRPGTPALTGIVLAGTAGEIVLDAELL